MPPQNKKPPKLAPPSHDPPSTPAPYDPESPADLGLGFDTFTTKEKNAWETQTIFLRHFALWGVIAPGATAAGVHRASVHRWRQDDYLKFSVRWKHAHQHFLDWLEQRSAELIQGLRSGMNPLALTVRLNAEFPEKYRQAISQVDEGVRRLNAELDAKAQEYMRQRRGPPPKRKVEVRPRELGAAVVEEAEKVLGGG